MFHLLFLFGIYNRFPERILKNFPLSTGESEETGTNIRIL
ncbi:hypothetical protein M103_4974 [Bacteroides fragilis str. 1007-1-F 